MALTVNRRVAILAAGALVFAGTAAGTSVDAQTGAATPPSAPASGADSPDAAHHAWSVLSGYKRYGGNCAVCHGPDGMGGTFAPALVESLKSLDHDQFLTTVVNGKKDKNLTMPSFGTDPNVMCYIEDIYVYLKLRSDGKLDRGRPAGNAAKPKDVAEAENACMGV